MCTELIELKTREVVKSINELIDLVNNNITVSKLIILRNELNLIVLNETTYNVMLGEKNYKEV